MDHTPPPPHTVLRTAGTTADPDPAVTDAPTAGATAADADGVDALQSRLRAATLGPAGRRAPAPATLRLPTVVALSSTPTTAAGAAAAVAVLAAPPTYTSVAALAAALAGVRRFYERSGGAGASATTAAARPAAATAGACRFLPRHGDPRTICASPR